MEEYKSRVYTERPAYADFEAPAKFDAIRSMYVLIPGEVTATFSST